MTTPGPNEAPIDNVLYTPPLRKPGDTPRPVVRVIESIDEDQISYRTGFYPMANRRSTCNVNTWVKWARRKNNNIRPLTSKELALVQ